MSRIAEVARLKELQEKAASEERTFAIIENVPWLLAVAGQFQAGDADILKWMLTGAGDFDDENNKQNAIDDCLRRMLAAAKIMEAEL